MEKFRMKSLVLALTIALGSTIVCLIAAKNIPALRIVCIIPVYIGIIATIAFCLASIGYAGYVTVNYGKYAVQKVSKEFAEDLNATVSVVKTEKAGKHKAESNNDFECRELNIDENGNSRQPLYTEKNYIDDMASTIVSSESGKNGAMELNKYNNDDHIQAP